jgi:hypothetical protein
MASVSSSSVTLIWPPGCRGILGDRPPGSGTVPSRVTYGCSCDVHSA